MATATCDQPTAPAIDFSNIHTHASIVAAWLRLYFRPGDVTELRCVGVTRSGYRKPHIESGFYDYDHLDDMALAAVRITDTSKGCYFVMNPLRPEILARRANRIEPATGDFLACDKDVLFRNWLLIDCDPIRDPLVSATEAEKEAARQQALAVLEYLRVGGWPDPIFADSGNGYHLFYRVSMTNDDLATKTAKAILNGLADKFDAPASKVDRKVFNASRIVKLPGTLARKGDHREDRPHRRAKLLSVPGVDLTGYTTAAIAPSLETAASPAA